MSAADSLIEKGNQLLHTQDYHAALETFRRALDLAPSATSPLIGYGRCLLAMHQPKDAVPFFERALEIDSNRWDSWLFYGDCLLALGETQRACETYKRASLIDPRKALCLERLAKGYYEQRDFWAALDFNEKCASLLPDSATAERITCRIMAVRCKMELGKFPEALQIIEEVICKRIDSSDLWVDRGICLFNVGQTQFALNSFHYACLLAPQHPSARQWKHKCEDLHNQ